MCHGVQAPWQDDNKLIAEFKQQKPEAIDMMIKKNIIAWDEELDRPRINLGKMPAFLMSGMRQLYQKNQELESRLVALGG